MRVKDVIALGLLALVSFPVILLGVLMWTGNVRLAFGPEDASQSAARERLQVRPEDLEHQTVLPVPGGGAGMDGALGLRESELDRREAEVQREMIRLGELRDQTGRLRDTIEQERKRIESLLVGRDSVEITRLQVLARTFTGMKPDQAAKILNGLDDVLVTGILRTVSEDRPRAKILAAIGKLDAQRAAAIARLLRSVDGRGSAPAAAPAAAAAKPPAAEPAADKPAEPTAATPPKEAKP